ncbi:MAG TPA: sensor histidine kinase [Gammaproteobacteria bacterium]|nr:sensor histidine kinase [Xanthomonadales bacterium]MCB1595542.1 sensor histidine kinase [Xanthomonadales bacterium]HOP22440.1 sensor histidine kinase [Gammaproteobacteria bacterium]HPQ87717.1 sensor histidine kinase [Gammaproteobacteria bacterium]
MINRFSHISLIRLAGLIIWLSLSVPFVMKVFIDPQWLNSKSILWLLSHLSFGIGFIILTKHLGHEKLNKDEWVLLFAMIAVIYIINWSTISMSGMFYSLIIAILLPWIMSVKQGVLILILQNLLLAWQLFADMQYWEEFESMQAGRVILQFYWIGISSFSYVLSLVAFRQQNAKEELRKLNSELRATQVLLAESSRINERLRISRELHDLIGHHLTALSLNLEVASHITKNKAHEHVKKAQSIARLLLSDVRNVVSAFRNKGNLNFYQAIVELTDDIPKLNIHIDIDEDYTIEDPRLAQTMLRCTQELITNSIKHAQAKNLWIHFSKNENEVIFSIEDDGTGDSQSLREGNGLTGIRERVKQFNGEIEILNKSQGICVNIILRAS